MRVQTLIEFYDEEPLCNVLAALLLRPERVVFVGAGEGKRRGLLQRFFREKGLNVSVSFVRTRALDAAAVASRLRALARKYPGCAADITGGRDEALFAAGLFCREAGVPAFRIDFPRRALRGMYRCAALEGKAVDVRLTVADRLMLAGGALARHGHVAPGDMDEAMLRDTDAVWRIYLQYRDAWNAHVQYLQYATPAGQGGGELWTDAPRVIRTAGGGHARADDAVLRALGDAGVIQELALSQARVRFRYKNETLKKCLRDVGVWLEMHVYRTALKTGAFDDVQLSAVIDWNGVPGERDDVLNEVDVALTRGAGLILISCKTGSLRNEALNELYTLAQRFGGRAARAAVVTMDEPSATAPALYRRAAELGIAVIGREELTGNRLEERLRALAGL